MTAASSLRVVPMASRERIRRSMETEGSPASILATRDWLEPSSFASWPWESRLRARRSLSRRLSVSFSSTRAASASVRPKNSVTLPTVQPARRRRSRLFLFMGSTSLRLVVHPETAPTVLNDPVRGLPARFGKDLQNHDGVGVDPINDAPVVSAVSNTQLSSPPPHPSHNPRMRHPEVLAHLQPAQEAPRLKSRLG